MTQTVALPSSQIADYSVPSEPAARVLQQIRITQPTTRRELQDTLDYSQAAVARYVTSLREAGLVEQISAATDRRDAPGRPGSLLRTTGGTVAVGAHIGLHRSHIVSADVSGRISHNRELRLDVGETDPYEALEAIAYELRAATRWTDTETPHVGVALSAHVDDEGTVTEPAYNWRDVPVAEVLTHYLGVPVQISSGVAAMAGHELLNRPLDAAKPDKGATLYFYARELVAHAWIVHGTVHEPASGGLPLAFERVSKGSIFDTAEVGVGHPLGNSNVVHAAQREGIQVQNFAQLAAIGIRNERARGILDARAHLLAQTVALAADIVGPTSIVLAGEAFTIDRLAPRIVAETLKNSVARRPSLRLQPEPRGVLTSAAAQAALNGLWNAPLR